MQKLSMTLFILIIFISACYTQPYPKDVTNEEICLKVKEPCKLCNYKNSCFRDLAMNLEDATYCSKSGDLKEICVEAVAVKTENFTLCPAKEDPWSDIFRDCGTKIAMKKNDSSLCNKTIYPMRCLHAFAIIEKNISLCDATDYKQDMCYYVVASKTKNMLHCEKIVEVFINSDERLQKISLNQRDRCISNIKNNITICDNYEIDCPQPV